MYASTYHDHPYEDGRGVSSLKGVFFSFIFFIFFSPDLGKIQEALEPFLCLLSSFEVRSTIGHHAVHHNALLLARGLVCLGINVDTPAPPRQEIGVLIFLRSRLTNVRFGY